MKKRDSNMRPDDEEATKLRARLDERIGKLIEKPAAESLRSDNHRTLARSSTRLVGVISGEGLPETSCIVTERSAEGFRLLLHVEVDLPDQINLKIPSQGLEGVVRKRWKQGLEVGVEFVVWNGEDKAGVAPREVWKKNRGDAALRLPDENSED